MPRENHLVNADSNTLRMLMEDAFAVALREKGGNERSFLLFTEASMSLQNLSKAVRNNGFEELPINNSINNNMIDSVNFKTSVLCNIGLIEKLSL